MSNGAKIFWAFAGGAVLGAAGLAYLNRNSMDFRYMKPIATDLLTRGMNLKDNFMTRVTAMKEDFEDMAAEARDRVDSMKMGEKAACNAEIAHEKGAADGPNVG